MLKKNQKERKKEMEEALNRHFSKKDMQMAKKKKKTHENTLNIPNIREMQIKTRIRVSSYANQNGHHQKV